MPLHPLLMRITVATGRLGNMPVATRIPSSNDPDDVTHAHCYSHQDHLSVTQCSNGCSVVICPLLLVPWVNR
jgi:hypothetical protein